MLSNLNNLIRRGKLVNEKIWGASFPAVPLMALRKITQYLNNILPDDFLKITTNISYECSPSFQFFITDVDISDWDGIIKNNLEIRKQYREASKCESDMSHILVLADDDGGSVFMITQDSPYKPTPVIWCDYGDMYYYSIHKKFQYPHDEWPSFTAFFEYLIEQEEKALEAGKE